MVAAMFARSFRRRFYTLSVSQSRRVRSRARLEAETPAPASVDLDFDTDEVVEIPKNLDRRKKRLVTEYTKQLDKREMAPKTHSLLHSFQENLDSLSDSRNEMFHRLSVESSDMLQQLHGEPSKQRLAQIQQRLIFEERERLGVIAEIPLRSRRPCSGCGALLHAEDVKVPGFVPLEIFVKLKADPSRMEKCLRCYSLEVHQRAMSVEVSDSEFPLILINHVTAGLREKPRAKTPLGREVEKKGVLFLLVLDALDPEGSIFHGIKDVIESAEKEIPPETRDAKKHRLRGAARVVLLVNKVDLLPKDSLDALDRWKDTLTRMFRQRTGLDERHHVATHLVSARTQFGIEDVINDLWMRWKMKGDVYLCGTSNAGKSTLFNSLLRSDICVPTAMDQISRATISAWPGTTLSVLKFPLNIPNDFKIKLREKRLREYRKWVVMKAEEDPYKKLTWDNIELAGEVGHTFEEYKRSEKQRLWQRHQLKIGVDLRALVAFEGDGAGGFKEAENEDWDKMFLKKFPSEKVSFDLTRHEKSIDSRWVFDTPGIVNHCQLVNYLVEEEIEDVLPKGIVPPRFCLLREGRSLLISGLIQIDFLEHFGSKLENRQIYLSVIASHALPLHVTWNFEDAARLRRQSEMKCELTREIRPTLPLVLEGDDPERGTGESRAVVSGAWIDDDDDVSVDSNFHPSNVSRKIRRGPNSDATGKSSPALQFTASSSSSSSSMRTRPRPLPPFTSQTFTIPGSIEPRWFERSMVEVTLSSIGFVGVATGSDCVLRVRSFGGADVGVGIRDEPLLPDIFLFRGDRGPRDHRPEDGKPVRWSPFFKLKKPIY